MSRYRYSLYLCYTGQDSHNDMWIQQSIRYLMGKIIKLVISLCNLICSNMFSLIYILKHVCKKTGLGKKETPQPQQKIKRKRKAKRRAKMMFMVRRKIRKTRKRRKRISCMMTSRIIRRKDIQQTRRFKKVFLYIRRKMNSDFSRSVLIYLVPVLLHKHQYECVNGYEYCLKFSRGKKVYISAFCSGSVYEMSRFCSNASSINHCQWFQFLKTHSDVGYVYVLL